MQPNKTPFLYWKVTIALIRHVSLHSCTYSTLLIYIPYTVIPGTARYTHAIYIIKLECGKQTKASKQPSKQETTTELHGGTTG